MGLFRLKGVTKFQTGLKRRALSRHILLPFPDSKGSEKVLKTCRKTESDYEKGTKIKLFLSNMGFWAIMQYN